MWGSDHYPVCLGQCVLESKRAMIPPELWTTVGCHQGVAPKAQAANATSRSASGDGGGGGGGVCVWAVCLCVLVT